MYILCRLYRYCFAFHGNFMGYPWVVRGLSAAYPSATHGPPMGYPRGTPTGYPCAVHGQPMGYPRLPTYPPWATYPWTTHGLLGQNMGCLRAIHIRLLTRCPQHTHGMSTVCPWATHGLSMGYPRGPPMIDPCAAHGTFMGYPRLPT